MLHRRQEESSPCLARLAVLLPAREPGSTLLEVVRQLGLASFGTIIVVDDGSSAACQALFADIQSQPGVCLLRHARNLGKGRALKTGINYFLAELAQLEGLVTADADGQHTAVDIARVAAALLTSEGRTVLGVRGFVRDVPLRSRLGNALTRQVFGFVTGTALVDTQTGLRAFPRAVLPELLVLEGERYEYEMTVLAHLCRTGRQPIELPIETIYLDGNKSSHFDPVRDSMRIYFVLIRFYASSIAAAAVDFLGFSATFAVTHNVLLSVLVGRLSSLVNFALNKQFVFQSRDSIKGSLLRYYILAVAIAALSYGSILAAVRYAHWNVFAAKIVIDVMLSLVSFSVQRTFVFRRNEEA